MGVGPVPSGLSVRSVPNMENSLAVTKMSRSGSGISLSIDGLGMQRGSCDRRIIFLIGQQKSEISDPIDVGVGHYLNQLV